MKEKFILLTVLAVLSISLPAQGQPWLGSGTAGDPYLIADANDMNEIGTHSEDWGSHFIMVNDINLAEYTGTQFNIIGNGTTNFTGVFDGNGFTISNFTYQTNGSYIGLFGYVNDTDAQIKNLGITDSNIHVGAGDKAGLLVGDLRNGYISRCYTEGSSVSGDRFVGGLVGHTTRRGAAITSCCTLGGSVSGNEDIGGLVGQTLLGTISDCYSTCSVSGNSKVGGLIGYHAVPLSNSYSSGSVSGSNYTGGLVGKIDMGSSAINSFWDVNSSGQASSAIGTGKTTAEMQDPNTFLDTGWDFVYESENGPSDIWAEPVGGGYMILWFQLSPLPELPTFSGGSGTVECPYLISIANELNKIGHNPRLMGANFKLIDDIDLAGISFFIIANEAYTFRGIFDGNGHEISNFAYHTNTSDIGLFGYVDGENAKVKHLGLIDPNVNAGEGDHVGSLVSRLGSLGTISDCYAKGGSVSGDNDIGGLVGWNEGIISNCYATVNVPGDRQVGGLVGWNIDGTIFNCFSSGSVSGYMHIGGLVGWSRNATISNCYSSASVSGNREIGGLVGENYQATISDCYSSGSVLGFSPYDIGGLVGRKFQGATATNSFWDVNSSGQDSSAGGTEKTTEEMYMESTFTSVGWDFATPVWEICEGTNYPKLGWQIPQRGDFDCPDGVDFIDFSILASSWLSTAGEINWNLDCDISDPNDDVIDELDLAVFCENWLAGVE